MILRRLAPLLVVVAISGCSTTPPPIGGPSPSGTTTAKPAASSPAPLPDDRLPLPFPLQGSLIDHAQTVVAKLHEVAGAPPVLKLDLTKDHATLTVLRPDKTVASYGWRDGEITRIESDLQYINQATFDPAGYPLGSVRRMFDIAGLRGVRGNLVLQIVEYRPGRVLMTVTSKPESSTVFFRRDGTAVADLGVTNVSDIAAGIREVVGADKKVYAVGFSAQRGYWADLPDKREGVVSTRSRVGGVPAFETRRNATAIPEAFDPKLLKPAALAKAIARFQGSPKRQCEVTVDLRHRRSAPVAAIVCGGKSHYTDMDGRDMTSLIEA